MNDRHHAGAADPGVDLVDTTHLERLDHALCGVVLLETEFGVCVQVAAKRRELRVQGRDVGKRAAVGLDAGGKHGGFQCPPPERSTRKRGSTAK